MKKNKSKGFTLIELLVVISIIALLSSVVLASLKSTREKSLIVKTVSEMKSLQNALELYRNQSGNYPAYDQPGVFYGDDSLVDGTCQSFIGHMWGCDGFDALIQNYLVNTKLISKVPHSPNYPNNCIPSVVGYTNCEYFGGYVLGYVYAPYADTNTTGLWFACGGKKIDNYFLYFTANDKEINLPLLTVSYGGSSEGGLSANGDINEPPYTYCLAM